MNIHVVCSNSEGDSILPRISRYLRDYVGWSLSEEPDKKADINLFIPYIDYSQRFPDWNKTKTAAYFSHHDTKKQNKSEWWEYAAKRVDLRICTAKRYAEEIAHHGKSIVAHAPIDPQFTIQPTKVINNTFKVGVVGINYKDKRKGEDLIYKAWKAMPELDWQASGRNWPFSSRWRNWSAMPEFYRSLDAYLCAARIEGVPMPPLEALACGTPVIVPSGVGMIDQLPDIPGIYRYKAGNHKSQIDAIKRAAKYKTKTDRYLLAHAVQEYTVSQWCKDIVGGIENVLGVGSNTYETVAKNDTGGRRAIYSKDRYIDVGVSKSELGMYCVAFGEPSRKCAITCIETFKYHMPDIPVAFVSDKPLGPEDIFIKQPDVDIGGRLGKLAVDRLAPKEWKYILYLDADTEIVGDIGFLYRLLVDGWEAVICKDMAKYHIARMMRRPDNQEEFEHTMEVIGTEEAIQYNGGVFAFRRCANTRKLFKAWNVEWQKWAARDQGALLRALHDNPVKLFVLGNQWNASDRYPWPSGDLAIIHHNQRARRWEGLIHGRTDSEMAWERVETWKSQNK